MNKYNSKEAKVERKLLKVLARELAEATFKEAQSMVPKSSGNLEKTGSIVRIMNDGFVITYTAPYAYNIHEGKSEFKNLTSPHVSWVDGKTVGGTDGFWRKVPNKREPIKVKAHSKTYRTIGERPVYMKGVSKKQFRKGSKSPDWIIKNVNLPREKNEWVQKAWTKVISKLPKEVKEYLPKRLKVMHKLGISK